MSSLANPRTRTFAPGIDIEPMPGVNGVHVAKITGAYPDDDGEILIGDPHGIVSIYRVEPHQVTERRGERVVCIGTFVGSYDDFDPHPVIELAPGFKPAPERTVRRVVSGEERERHFALADI